MHLMSKKFALQQVVGFCRILRHLDLSLNDLESYPLDQMHLPRLQTLRLKQTKISQVQLASLVTLKLLDVSRNKINRVGDVFSDAAD